MQDIKSTQNETAISFSLPRSLLHLEGVAFFAASIALYADQGYSGLAFILLLFLPDAAMLGYLHSLKLGAWLYNAVHTYLFPLALIGLGFGLDWSLGIQLGLIFAAHISMDRAIGYGLKYASAFKDTHLQRA